MCLNYSVLVAVLVCYYTGEMTAADCGVGYWGNNCQYYCKCLDQQEKCDKNTGTCVSGCKAGWAGPGCSVFRCWYDDPVVTNSSSTCFDSKSECPKEYMCVKRDYYMSGQPSWQGCCPKGKGPCHTATQWISPDSGVADLVPPSCDTQGNYSPRQCPALAPGCFCVLPNGTNIEGSFHSWKDQNTVNCTNLVTNLMKENVCSIAGQWGENCKHQCMCNDDNEQCDRLTGHCKSGCRSGYTGTGCQEIFKCWFGEAITRTSTVNCYDEEQGDCPSNHVCVTRRYMNLEQGRYDRWYGCCPNGNGPCDKRRQTIAPIDSEGDLIPPECDQRGNYMPKQCGVFGCGCVFPNGTHIDGSHRQWRDSFKMNCTAMIQSKLGVISPIIQKNNTKNSTVDSCTDLKGRWGEKCEYQCLCNDIHEQCHKTTGRCVSGCRPGYTGEGCQEIFKCWFGKPVERSSKTQCHMDDPPEENDCPENHVCVVRRFNNYTGSGPSLWYGCCPNGKGPCDKKRQTIAPIDGQGDLLPPDCDNNGQYLPQQCGVFGCSCVLPNGTYISDTSKGWDESHKIDCNEVVRKVLAGECSGLDCLSALSHREKLGLIVGMSFLAVGIVGLILALIIHKVGQKWNSSASSEKSKKYLEDGPVVTPYDEIDNKNMYI